jgi:hypothetical protein
MSDVKTAIALKTSLMLIRLTPNTPVGGIGGRGAGDLPQNAGRVPGPVCRRGGVSCLPRGFPLARWIPLPTVRALAGVRVVSPPFLGSARRAAISRDFRYGPIVAPVTASTEPPILSASPAALLNTSTTVILVNPVVWVARCPRVWSLRPPCRSKTPPPPPAAPSRTGVKGSNAHSSAFHETPRSDPSSVLLREHSRQITSCYSSGGRRPLGTRQVPPPTPVVSPF